jgi:ribonuclease E
VETAESMAIDTMRLLMTRATREGAARIVVEIHDRVSNYLNNKKRREITGIEESCNVSISIIARNDVGPEHLLLKVLDDGGNELRASAPVASKSSR